MRTFAVRLAPGADLRAELQRLVAEHSLAAGCVVTCVGSLSRACLRMPGAAGEAEQVLTLEEPTEILSLSGTLAPDGLHLHVALSRRDGACVGGHLMPGSIVATTAELVLADLPQLAFRRPLDPATGYNELSVEPRPEG